MPETKDLPIVETAIALNLIYDIIDRVKKYQGIELTPETIGRYIVERKSRREQLNAKLGV